MTEKQRWLLRDLDMWRDKQTEKIGRYGPRRPEKPTAAVRAARKAAARAALVIRRWDESKNAPWKKQKAALAKQVENVKRIILFEKTEAALRAIRGLERSRRGA